MLQDGMPITLIGGHFQFLLLWMLFCFLATYAGTFISCIVAFLAEDFSGFWSPSKTDWKEMKGGHSRWRVARMEHLSASIGYRLRAISLTFLELASW
jgi:hypothetical protein